MNTFDVGRLCIKIAGRDARKKCVIVEVLDTLYVMIDGETRRRKCNINHLEPLTETIDIKKGASHEDIVSAFKKLGIELLDKKPKTAGERPRRKRKTPEELRAQKEERTKEKEKLVEETAKVTDELAQRLGVDTEAAVPTEPPKTETLTEETKEITEKKPETTEKKDETEKKPEPAPKTKQQKEDEVKEMLKGE